MNHLSSVSKVFGPKPDLVRVGSRRWLLQTGLAGLAGLPFARYLESVASASSQGKPTQKKSVILFWLSGAPSHIDMWDPKPEAPIEIRGPFQSISTSVPGVRF